MHLGRILFGRLFRGRIIGDKTVVSLYAFPETKLSDVVLQYAGAEIDVVLDLKKIEVLPIRRMSPGWQMNLHHSDRVLAGNREGIPAAFDDHDACDQPSVHIMVPGADDNRLGDAAPNSLRNFIPS